MGKVRNEDEEQGETKLVVGEAELKFRARRGTREAGLAMGDQAEGRGRWKKTDPHQQSDGRKSLLRRVLLLFMSDSTGVTPQEFGTFLSSAAETIQRWQPSSSPHQSSFLSNPARRPPPQQEQSGMFTSDEGHPRIALFIDDAFLVIDLLRK